VPGSLWHSSACIFKVCTLPVHVLLLLQTDADGAPAAHMHRDMKPGNMCLRPVDGKWLPVVMDFGAWCRQDKSDFFSAFDHR
jgi:hypothetical protein